MLENPKSVTRGRKRNQRPDERTSGRTNKAISISPSNLFGDAQIAAGDVLGEIT